ncbi:NodT family efflux transporter outer membrane factor (OMF) lipoprotein [Comamonas sp. BIGb0152]|uniref:efflux transporter outer membrane subunit n=1 Tax=Comamonas sp. BIGb0152 TaxID=2940601 RepID=UPI002166CCA5|nr:efflux transporter outer membrane subunit [Comamonas sp. BIGb0152]MCS4296212.1 NodT family efflux transporter outer membrane factor (OMF) lipoprotein [Comamonas sp. BIGb0152]
MLRHTAFIFALSSLAAGCAVGPDYQRPITELPGAYRGSGVLGDAVSVDPSAATELGTWWTAFSDPDLGRYVTAALRQNLDLAQASARVLQARSGLDAAEAALLPSGNIAAQTARSHQSTEMPLGQVLSSLPGYSRFGNLREANLEASWELDLFGGLRRAKEASSAEYAASEATATAVRLAIAAQTADTYLQIRGLQTRLEVARKQVQTKQQLRSTIGLRFEKGIASELQLHQAEGALSQALATIAPLETALDASLNAMDVMLATVPGTHRAELAVHRPVPDLPTFWLTDTPADLLRRRPDIIAAERRLAASSARIGIAFAEYYPKLSISGLVGSATSLASGKLFTGGASQAGAMAGLRWRLFDFGRINAQISQAQAQEAEALAAYRQAILRATEDVENALVAMDKRRELMSVLDMGAASLLRARQASGAAYEQGVVSLIEVLQADESLLRVLDAQAQNRTDAARSAVAVFKALGGGWTLDAANSSPVAVMGNPPQPTKQVVYTDAPSDPKR